MVTFFLFCDQIAGKSTLVKEGLICLSVEVMVRHDRDSMAAKREAAGRSHGINSQETEQDECWYPAHLLLFIQSRTPALRVPDIYSGSFPSVNLI